MLIGSWPGRAVLTGLGLCAGESLEVLCDGSRLRGYRRVRSLDGTNARQHGFVPDTHIEEAVRASPPNLRRGLGFCPRVSGPSSANPRTLALFRSPLRDILRMIVNVLSRWPTCETDLVHTRPS